MEEETNNAKDDEKKKHSEDEDDDARWGYIDATGNYVIPPRFRKATAFSGDLAFVIFPDKSGWYAIDRSANVLNGPFLDIRFMDALAPGPIRVIVSTGDGDESWGAVDRNGQFVIPPQFAGLVPFGEGFGAFTIWSNGRRQSGYLDKTGSVVIEAQFDSARCFSEGLAAVRIDEKWGFINKAGEMVIAPQFDGFDALTAFHHGLARMNAGGVQHPRGFVEGGKWGYIDKTGRWAIPPKFDSAYSFDEHGVAAVGIGDRHGYINRQGEYIWEPTK